MMAPAPALAFVPSKPVAVSFASSTNPTLFSSKVNESYMIFFQFAAWSVFPFLMHESPIFQFDNDNKGLEVVGEENNSGPSDKEVMESAISDVKVRGQIGAVGVLTIAFSAFVYLKLQYDADPSNFIGSH